MQLKWPSDILGLVSLYKYSIQIIVSFPYMPVGTMGSECLTNLYYCAFMQFQNSFRWLCSCYIKLSIGSSDGRTESTLLHQKFAHVLWYCLPPYVSLPSACFEVPGVLLFTFNRQIPQATLPSSVAET